jgi:organic hydroperoxide reductase OsmC/OhrA
MKTKEFHFPLAVEWAGGRTVTVHVDGKAALDVTPPPAFRGTEPHVWSPEDLFVAAAAACLGVTFTGFADRAGLAYDRLSIAADGVAGRREDGRFGFTRVDLRLEVEAADAGLARELAEKAEADCLVSASFDLPVETEIVVLSPATV